MDEDVLKKDPQPKLDPTEILQQILIELRQQSILLANLSQALTPYGGQP